MGNITLELAFGLIRRREEKEIQRTMKTNQLRFKRPNVSRSIRLSFPTDFVRQMVDIKLAILAESAGTASTDPRMLHLALKEAEALAWQTDFPLLVFPALAEEKIQALAAWSEHQKQVRDGQNAMAFAE